MDICRTKVDPGPGRAYGRNSGTNGLASLTEGGYRDALHRLVRDLPDPQTRPGQEPALRSVHDQRIPSLAPADLAAGVPCCRGVRGWAKSPAAELRGFTTGASGTIRPPVGLVLKRTNCNTASITSMFYRGPDAHLCRACGTPFELSDPRHDRRSGVDRRAAKPYDGIAEWRSGFDRRV